MNDLKFTTAGDYMNTVMEDLMYRSGLTASGCWDQMDEYDRKAVEKFAELIVRECVSEIEKNYVGQVGTHASAHNSAIKKSVDSIKHLYGVAE
jgi:hypothetical protein